MSDSPEGAKAAFSGPYYTSVPNYLWDMTYDGKGPVTAATVRTYAHIVRFYVWRAEIFPSHSRLATELKTTERTIRRHLNALRDAGALTWGHRVSKKGRSSNQYAVAPWRPFCFDREVPDTDVRWVADADVRNPPDTDVRNPPDTDVRVVERELLVERELEQDNVLRPSAPSVDAAAPVDDAVREDVEHICKTLADAVEANGSKRPTVTKQWRDEGRRLLDRDGRTVAQVLVAIEWCQGDDFWRSNIMSMPTLRKQYDRLRLAAMRKPQGVGHQAYQNPTDNSGYHEPW